MSEINGQLKRTPIAIIGMAGIFPQAGDLNAYWENILHEVDCITDVPPSRWDVDDYYDPDPTMTDKTYAKRGGFIPDIKFNPMEFGLPPNILELTDVSQLLSLVVAKRAMADAGCGNPDEFDREHTGVILGVGGGQKLITPLTTRLQYPVWERVLKSYGLPEQDIPKIIDAISRAYVKWEENSFPGMLGNVISGRIANRLDLGGINCVVDAACAASLSAFVMALGELVEHRQNMMITGGVDTDNSIFMYMAFSKTPAFSKRNDIRPFDVNNDGMLVGEGVGMAVLKRLEEAERDGDRIYAVIKGIGASSDGKSKSIYAPSSAGQTKALRRAYEEAGFPPATVTLIEAHGTGTVAGDPTEFEALDTVFSENNPRKQYIALGSVKSQIGHTKSAAGAASVIKAALALYHGILPATLNITKPNPLLKIEDSPFYLNTETRPWFRASPDIPRRAGISAFGFGGSNYHIVLEEHTDGDARSSRLHRLPETFLIFAGTPERLAARCDSILLRLQSGQAEKHYAELVETCRSVEIPVEAARLGFVAESPAAARDLLKSAIGHLKKHAENESWEHPDGIYYRKTGIDPQGKIVALFSGQGSQYINMGKELAMSFPAFRRAYETMDIAFHKDGLSPISDVVFPQPVFEESDRKARAAALQRTEHAQPAIGAFGMGLYNIFKQAGFSPDFVAGHSFGELAALWAAGIIDAGDYCHLAKARGRAMAAPADPDFDAGTMLAVEGDVENVPEAIKKFPGIIVANWNSNRQIVLAGPKADMAAVRDELKTLGFSVIPLPVSAAFHTPLVNHAKVPFANALDAVAFKQSGIPVYSNTTGECYPEDPEAVKQILKSHIVSPVRFRQMIETIYEAGGAVFVEFGPKSVMTNLVKNILEGKPHVAVALDTPWRRAAKRVSVQMTILVEDSLGKAFTLDVENVSAMGAGLRNVPDNWTTGTPIRLQLPPAEGPEKQYVKGHIVWQYKKCAGVKFELAPARQTALRDWLKTLDRGESQPSRAPGHARQLKDAAVRLRVAGLPLRDIDSHRAPQALSDDKKKEFTVNLNGSNYVSDATKTAFEKALEKIHKNRSNPGVNEKHVNIKVPKGGTVAVPKIATANGGLCKATNDVLEETGQFDAHIFSYQTEPGGNMYKPDTQVPEQAGACSASDHSALLAFQQTIYQAQMQFQQTLSQCHMEFMRTSSLALQSLSGGQVPAEIPLSPRFDAAQPLTAAYPATVITEPVAQPVAQPEYYTPPQPTNSMPPVSEPCQPVQPTPVVAEAPMSAPQPESMPDTALPASASSGEEDFKTVLIQIVADKTGYPEEMLDLDLELESGLGIDSIKRVEILSELQERYPQLAELETEKLTALQTLGEIHEMYHQTEAGEASSRPFETRPQAA